MNSLKKFKSVNLPIVPKKITHAFYRCYIQVNKNHLKNGWTKHKIIEKLIKKGVPCNEGSCSELYREKSFKKVGHSPKKRLQNAKKLSESSIAFQVDHTINFKELQNIILSIKQTFLSATK